MKARFLILILLLTNIFSILFLLSRPRSPALDIGRPLSKIRREITVQTNFLATTLDWATIESQDYRVFIDNLRRINCPEETIRDIIIADVNKLYAARKTKVHISDYPDKILAPDWQLFKIYGLEIKQLVDLDLERKLVLKELLHLGDETVPPARCISAKSMIKLGFLNSGRRESVAAIMLEYEDRQNELLLQFAKEGKIANITEMQQITSSRDIAIAAILSPGEFETFLFRFHSRGETLRGTLYGFNPTLDEFRFIFGLAEALDEKHPIENLVDQRARDERQEDLAILNRRLRSYLGDRRYQDYDRCWKPEYKVFTQLGSQFDLSPLTISTAADLFRDAADKTKAVRERDREYSDATRNQAEEVQRNFLTKLRATIGDSAFQAFTNRY